jgi:hypothetical protein
MLITIQHFLKEYVVRKGTEVSNVAIRNIDHAIQIAKDEIDAQIRAGKGLGSLPYAMTYLHAIDDAIAIGGTHGMSVQLLYAMSNMSGWKGETARAVKAFMKVWIKKNP